MNHIVPLHAHRFQKSLARSFVDCTVVPIIIRKHFDSLCFWTFCVLSDLAEPAYAGPVYTGIFYDVLQIPQYVASKGIVRKILGMPNRALHLATISVRFIAADELDRLGIQICKKRRRLCKR